MLLYSSHFTEVHIIIHWCKYTGPKTHSNVSTGFLQQDSQCSCNFAKVENVGDLALSGGKFQCFVGERSHFQVYIYVAASLSFWNKELKALTYIEYKYIQNINIYRV